MKKFSESELKTFEQMVQLTEEGLLFAVSKFAHKHYQEVYTTKDYVYAVGEIPVLLVAHLDTVFKKPVQDLYFDERKQVLWSPQGLGADDRAGVYSIIEVVKSGLRPTILFTTKEEVGGIGAAAFIKDFPECPENLKMIIELDRHGADDCVFYDCDNDNFVDFIETFGFVFSYGSFSDISIIAPFWKIAAVNLSIGYENEHSINEILHIGRMKSTILKVKRILTYVKNSKELLPFKYIPSKYSFYGGKYDSQFWKEAYGYIEDSDAGKANMCVACEDCGKTYAEQDAIPVIQSTGEIYNYCMSCFSKTSEKLHWCSICGYPYVKHEKRKDAYDICQSCLEELQSQGV